MNKKFYITTPIYYPSGNWHLGTCYTTVNCDAIARFKKMDGYEVFFLTGTDEHGQKVEECAKAAGVTPKAYIDERVDALKKLWERLNIKYDRFIRTTDDDHKATAQKIFKTLYDNGDIYKSEYVGKYCTPCESFWTDSQLVGGKCPDCGREVSEAREESYFFRLSKYSTRLERLYADNPEFLEPASRVNEMLNNFIRPGLTDLCVSRTTFKWGIPVSFDERHVMYVWIDALANYLSALKYGSDDDTLYVKFWPADLHMVGKEIVRFHAIVWPALLMALGLPLPKRVYGHGWLLFDNDKMSKSKCNVVDPFILSDRYTPDAVRYFLLREIPFGSDGNYTSEIFLNRINADLANDLGNLLNRTTAMTEQYFGGKLPELRVAESIDDELISLAAGMLARVRASIDSLSVSEALHEIFRLVQRANKYIDETRPWSLAKEEKDKPRLAAVLYNVLESLRISAVLLYPFIPETAEKIYKSLGLSEMPVDFSAIKEFGGLPIDIIHVKTDPIFPRFDVKKEISELAAICSQAEGSAERSAEKPATPAKNADAPVESISIEDFLRVKLVTARVVACEKVEKRDKLLKLTLDVNGAERTVISGIAQHYSSDALVGKTVVLVSNLKPARLGGFISEGMILCADDGKNVILVTPEKETESGSEVR